MDEADTADEVQLRVGLREPVLVSGKRRAAPAVEQTRSCQDERAVAKRDDETGLRPDPAHPVHHLRVLEILVHASLCGGHQEDVDRRRVLEAVMGPDAEPLETDHSLAVGRHGEDFDAGLGVEDRVLQDVVGRHQFRVVNPVHDQERCVQLETQVQLRRRRDAFPRRGDLRLRGLARHGAHHRDHDRDPKPTAFHPSPLSSCKVSVVRAVTSSGPKYWIGPG